MDSLSSIKVAILGAGFSAAYINYECQRLSIQPTVFAPAITGAPSGAFWLRDCPDHSVQPDTISVSSVGNPRDYMTKQWGAEYSDLLSSFPTEQHEVKGFSPAVVWDRLWINVQFRKVRMMSDERIARIAKDFDIVFLTFPTEESKEENDKHRIWFRVAEFPTSVEKRNHVVYQGELRSRIVRASSLFGKMYFEYIPGYDPKAVSFETDVQLRSAPDLHPDTPEWDPERVPSPKVVLAGRFAQWSRKVLTHDAKDRARKVIKHFANTGEVKQHGFE